MEQQRSRGGAREPTEGGPPHPADRPGFSEHRSSGPACPDSVRTLTGVLGDALEELKKEDFDRFCSRLLDRRFEPRVARRLVEEKSRLEVTGVMVGTFTELMAWCVAVGILRDIGCSEEAESLAEEANQISWPSGYIGSAPGSAAGTSSALAPQGPSPPSDLLQLNMFPAGMDCKDVINGILEDQETRRTEGKEVSF